MANDLSLLPRTTFDSEIKRPSLEKDGRTIACHIKNLQFSYVIAMPAGSADSYFTILGNGLGAINAK